MSNNINMKSAIRKRNTITSQNNPINGREQEMVQNNAGGFTFVLDKWGYLERFLILGSEDGSYYVSGQELSKQNAKNIIECIKEDGMRVIRTITDISDRGRAAKNSPALLALALCFDPSIANLDIRNAASEALPKIARTGTHLLMFCDFVNSIRGWGRGLKTAVGNWFINRSVDNLAYQSIKYKQRDGWALRDILRLSHPIAKDASTNDILKYIAHPEKVSEVNNELIQAAEMLKTLNNDKSGINKAVNLITNYNLPRECIPSEFLNDIKIWDALLQNMPITAMIRNLGKMTSIGLIKDLSDAADLVSKKLHNEYILKKGRVHPITILFALSTYDAGHGVRGKLSWNPVQQVVSALNDSFYLSFETVEKTNKRILMGMDVSGSMSSRIFNSHLSCMQGSLAMAMVNRRIEDRVKIMGFSHQFIELNIGKNDSLIELVNRFYGMRFGATDCALPMIYAIKNRLEVDTFIVYTDNETWAGQIHPIEALREYRQRLGINAKLIVVGMTSTNFTIADPKDAGMLDVVGFDTSVPNIISNFMVQ